MAMAPSSFGPYRGMWLEDTQSKRIYTTPRPWAMVCGALDWYHSLHSTSISGSVIEGNQCYVLGLHTNKHVGDIDGDGGLRACMKVPKLAESIFNNQQGLEATVKGTVTGGMAGIGDKDDRRK
jgi:hypothetical protein